MKLALIRFCKKIFIRLKLHVLYAPFTGIGAQLTWMTKLSKWISDQPEISFNDFPCKWNYHKRFELYKYIVATENLQEPLNYLEFGVADGHSFNWWMTENTHIHSRFYGFDTFTGLPEDFGPYKKGAFANSNNIPAIKDERGKFFQGLFQQTLPAFLKQYVADKKNVIMLDADLYSSTLFVLTSLFPFLKKGDIIFFDEFTVPTHEFMAYQQFIDCFYINLELLGAANNYYFFAFKLK